MYNVYNNDQTARGSHKLRRFESYWNRIRLQIKMYKNEKLFIFHIFILTRRGSGREQYEQYTFDMPAWALAAVNVVFANIQPAHAMENWRKSQYYFTRKKKITVFSVSFYFSSHTQWYVYVALVAQKTRANVERKRSRFRVSRGWQKHGVSR